MARAESRDKKQDTAPAELRCYNKEPDNAVIQERLVVVRAL